MNWHAVKAIYHFEMARMFRTVVQSIVAPVLSTSLYFVVFGSAIGSRIQEVDGTSYGAFIVPGLIMLSILTESIGNASFGIYFPRFTGTIYEVLSAPVSAAEVIMGYVGAAATKSLILGAIILATASLFVPIEVKHPFFMVAFLAVVVVTAGSRRRSRGSWPSGAVRTRCPARCWHRTPSPDRCCRSSTTGTGCARSGRCRRRRSRAAT